MEYQDIILGGFVSWVVVGIRNIFQNPKYDRFQDDGGKPVVQKRLGEWAPAKRKAAWCMMSQAISEMVMATIRKGTLTPPPEWWRRLRVLKRVYWKAERRAAKAEAGKQKLEGQG